MNQRSLNRWIFNSFYNLGVSCAVISLTGWLIAVIGDKSNYLFAKRCALAIGRQNPVMGVGPGNFNQALDNLDEDQLTGLIKLKNFDPHSTYFGGFAETGIIGLLSILLLFYFALRKMNSLLVRTPKAVWYCLLVAIQIFLIEGISTDIMNFRNLWVILGIISGIPPYAPDQGSAFTPP